MIKKNLSLLIIAVIVSCNNKSVLTIIDPLFENLDTIIKPSDDFLCMPIMAG